MNPDPAVASPSVDPADRLCDLVGEALERPAGERTAFLKAACADDAALLAEAMSLVQHGEQAGRFLGQPAHALMQGEDLGGLEAGSLSPGETLGECRIVSLLGEGGMGEVYLAQDTKLERPVAVKLLKRRLDDASLARRFRHERRVLAALSHPNIARLYGGGTTEEGRSYLVMEYVEGERLDRFCDARGLNVGERTALFRKVCAAVAYAHQNLVVHRDLKPANIRVTAEGEPKLLDFGIAKLLDPEGADARPEPTLTLQGAMTPEYASPEQLRGEPVTTTSDVYSLGVVLYELLTGQRPFAHLKGRRPDELARAVCEEEPPRPSAVAGSTTTIGLTTRVRRSLAGDLDNIVAKALRKEPSRRYPSVLALSEDLRRHGEGLPVSARRDTLAYRLGKFVQRNKVAVAAGVFVLLALVGGLAATILEARRADRRFEDVRQLAQSILFEVEPQLSRLPGSIPVRSTLVNKALIYLDRLAQEAGNRRDLRRELAAAYEKIGAVQGEPNQPNLGDCGGALTSFLKARDLRQALAANGRDLQARHELTDCEEHIGVILFWSNQTAAAERRLREVLAMRRRLVDEQPRSADFRRGLASTLVRLGDIPNWNDRSAEALALYREALPILEALVRERPQDTEVHLDLVRCLQNMADAQKECLDYVGATTDLAAADKVLAPLASREPDDARVQTSLWYNLYSTTLISLTQQAAGEALARLPRLLAAAQALAKSAPDDAGAQHDLAISYDAGGAVLTQAQRWQEAAEAYQAAIEIDSRLAANSPVNADYQRSCGSYQLSTGRLRVRLGQFAQAEENAQAAQGLLESAASRDPDNTIAARELIQLYDFRGDLCEQYSEGAKAREWYQRALETIRSHAAMDIPASDQAEWTALREKLAIKTAPGNARTSLR